MPVKRKDIFVKDILEPLGLSLEELREAGKQFIGGTTKEWAAVGMDTKVPLSSLALLVTASELILPLANTAQLIPIICREFRDIIIGVPDIVEAQLNGATDLPPVVINLLENEIVSAADVEENWKFFSLSDQKQLSVEEMAQHGHPLRSYAFSPSMILLRIFGGLIFELQEPANEIPKQVDIMPS